MIAHTHFFQSDAAHSESTRRLILIVMLCGAVAFIHFYMYVDGYRLSNDDVWFLKLFVEGYDSVIGHGILMAKEQGRIGQLLMNTVNVIASWLSTYQPARIAFVLLYVINLMLFSIYISMIIKKKISLFLFIILVSVHPLLYQLMPPNAYPLQNSLPFLLILFSRIIIASQGAAPGAALSAPMLSAPIHGLASAVFALGMFFSEFAVAFGTSLLIAEYGLRLVGTGTAAAERPRRLSALVRHRHFLYDSAAVLAVIVPYLVFKIWYPGSYAGNLPGGLFHVHDAIYTAMRHIASGTIFAYLSPAAVGADTSALLAAASVGGLSALALYLSSSAMSRIGKPGLLAILFLFLSFYVSLPIAVSLKYQEQCVGWSSCGYLDSRIAYFWVGAGAAATVSFLLQRLAGRVALATTFKVLAITSFATLSAATYMHNVAMAADMRTNHLAWKRVALLACEPALATIDDTELLRLIAPHPLIQRSASEWRMFIEWERKRSGCAGEDRQRSRGTKITG